MNILSRVRAGDLVWYRTPPLGRGGRVHPTEKLIGIVVDLEEYSGFQPDDIVWGTARVLLQDGQVKSVRIKQLELIS